MLPVCLVTLRNKFFHLKITETIIEVKKNKQKSIFFFIKSKTIKNKNLRRNFFFYQKESITNPNPYPNNIYNNNTDYYFITTM